MEEKTALPHPTDDDLRVEYQAAQNSAQHHDNLIWSINSVVWAASLVLLGFLLKLKPDRSLLLVVTLVSVLGILLVIKVWTYTFQLSKLKNHKYERCKEIEEKLGLQQHSTVRWPSGRQKKLYSAVMSLFIVIWLLVAWIHWKPLLCQHSALTGAVFLDCKLPNVASSEFLIDINKSRVINSQEFVDPDGSKIPSFNVLSIESDNIQLIRGYEGMLKGTKGRIKELIYINRYNLRATDRVWLNDAFVSGGDGTCKVVEKKL